MDKQSSPYTILKTIKGKLYGKACVINQCYQPEYNAGEKVGQNIFYIIDSSVYFAHDAFWNAINAGNIVAKVN